MLLSAMVDVVNEEDNNIYAESCTLGVRPRPSDPVIYTTQAFVHGSSPMREAHSTKPSLLGLPSLGSGA